MIRLTLPSPAKLNLFLHIVGRRRDGYHDLQTVFQLLDYGDQLTFRVRADNALRLTPDLPGVAPGDNLIIRSARLLQEVANCPLGADIELLKKLPMGGGIGGGSSNAATTLLALNVLWNLHLSLPDLASLGAQLGADVPIFVRGASAWAEGVGDRLQPMRLPACWYLVLAPECQVSTARVFSHKDLTRDSPNITVAAFLEQGGRNDCQPLVCRLYPEVDEALTWLQQHDDRARMTGTGACVFATFRCQADAEAVWRRRPPGMRGFVARGINQSPIHQLLSGL